MRTIACVLLFAAAAWVQSVEGIIVNTARGRGIPGARVDLSPVGERASQPLYCAKAIPNGPEFHVVAGQGENCGTGKVLLRRRGGADWASRTGNCHAHGRFD